jgi:hypothetical protein
MRKPAAAFPEPARWPGTIHALPNLPSVNPFVPIREIRGSKPHKPSQHARRRLWTAGRITALRAHGVRAARPPNKPLRTSPGPRGSVLAPSPTRKSPHKPSPYKPFPLLTSHFSLPSPSPNPPTSLPTRFSLTSPPSRPTLPYHRESPNEADRHSTRRALALTVPVPRHATRNRQRQRQTHLTLTPCQSQNPVHPDPEPGSSTEHPRDHRIR